MNKQPLNVVKLFLIVLCFAASLLLAGCRRTERTTEPERTMMIIVDETSGYTIYANKETKVMYFCKNNGYGKAVCVMLNEDGTPQTWRGSE